MDENEGVGVQKKLVNVCKSLYEGVEASALLGGECSRWFEVEAGLREGCPFLPVLYIVYVMEIVTEFYYSNNVQLFNLATSPVQHYLSYILLAN